MTRVRRPASPMHGVAFSWAQPGLWPWAATRLTVVCACGTRVGPGPEARVRKRFARHVLTVV